MAVEACIFIRPVVASRVDHFLKNTQKCILWINWSKPTAAFLFLYHYAQIWRNHDDPEVIQRLWSRSPGAKLEPFCDEYLQRLEFYFLANDIRSCLVRMHEGTNCHYCQEKDCPPYFLPIERRLLKSKKLVLTSWSGGQKLQDYYYKVQTSSTTASFTLPYIEQVFYKHVPCSFRCRSISAFQYFFRQWHVRYRCLQAYSSYQTAAKLSC